MIRDKSNIVERIELFEDKKGIEIGRISCSIDDSQFKDYGYCKYTIRVK
jgi:hypothetical protein